MSRTLSAYTTLGVGGDARRLFVARSAEELLSYPDALVLGCGSNVLVSDSGFDGDVVINRYSSFLRRGHAVIAGSGTSLGALTAFLAEEGLAGLEWACGIPGTVGGAVAMNAGAFSHTVSERLVYADIACSGVVTRYGADELRLGYRTSAVARGMTVVNACFYLDGDEPAAIKRRMRTYSELRRASQPRARSAGSVFKNPPGMSIARLIEGEGLKGYRVGGAQISQRHANIIINTGSALARDVVTIINTVKARLLDRGVAAEEEIIYVGDF